MQRKGISQEFVNEISERIQRLKKYGDVCNEEALSNMDSSVQMLSRLHDSNTGVPPPKDESGGTSLESSCLNSELEDIIQMKECTREDIETIKHENSKIKRDIESSLEAFKKANSEYMHSESVERVNLNQLEKEIQDLKGAFDEIGIDEEVDEIEDIMMQIDFLQQEIAAANDKVIESETLIMTKEIENIELRHKILAIEKSVMNIKEPVCKCTLF